jgi:hypothetical protein
MVPAANDNASLACALVVPVGPDAFGMAHGHDAALNGGRGGRYHPSSAGLQRTHAVLAGEAGKLT